MVVTKKECEQICKKFGTELKKFKLLGRGAHNENFILETNKGKIVLRIVNVKNAERLKKEYKILKKLNGKFGPKVYSFDESKKIIKRDYLLEELIEGENAPEKTNKKLLVDVAKFLKKLHSYSKIAVNKKKDLIYSSLDEYFKGYIKDFQKLKKVLEKDKILLEQIDFLFNKTQEICEKNKKLLSNRNKKSIIHGNVDPEHIMYSKSKIKLIDWEFARYGLEESDLIFFAYLYELKPKELEVFLKEYGYPSNKRRKKQFNILFLLHHLGLIIWSLERIEDIGKGDIYKNQKSSNVKGMKDHINLHIRKSKILLKSIK
jgi:aminoglycoside phosphotransferase (APT) family kinase protein|tara:strand:+ start:39 stop:989 length:951 start_codon:yes stop_codon:yes gene_type:complete